MAADQRIGPQVVELAGRERILAAVGQQLAGDRLGGMDRAVATDAAEDVLVVAEIGVVLAREPDAIG